MAVDAAWQFAFHFVHLSIHPPVRELHYFLEHFSEVDITCVTADLITGAQDGDEKDGRLHAMMLWWHGGLNENQLFHQCRPGYHKAFCVKLI